MAGWPSIDRADEQRLAQAFQAGDVSALAPIYDVYAPRLFDYCHVLLRDEETAAQALQDALIVVSERIASLPDPRLFRSWLYAVTRAECQRRRAHAEVPAERQKAAQADGLIEIDESTRRLVHEALLILSGQQREVLDLVLRHELDPHELAEVLFLTPQEASALTQQARGDLDDAFAAVVVAATGRDDCPSVDTLAGPPGAPLGADTCRTLARHIAGCPICGLRANGKVATARLLHAMPVAAVPADLRARALTAATAPQYAELRATIVMRADPPETSASEPDPASDQTTATIPTASHRDAEPGRGSRAGIALCGAVFGAALLLGGIFVLLPGTDGGRHNTGSQAIAAIPNDPTSADPSRSANAGPTKASPSRTPTPTPTPKASKTPKPKHGAKPPQAPPAPAPPQPPAPGSLSVSGCRMSGSYSCNISITAVGGPVNWSVTRASDPLEASGSGSLSSGASTSVTVRRQGFCLGSGNGSVSFSPNGSARITWFC